MATCEAPTAAAANNQLPDAAHHPPTTPLSCSTMQVPSQNGTDYQAFSMLTYCDYKIKIQDSKTNPRWLVLSVQCEWSSEDVMVRLVRSLQSCACSEVNILTTQPQTYEG